MRRFLLVLCALVALAYGTRERWLAYAPARLAALIEPAAASTPKSVQGGRSGGGQAGAQAGGQAGTRGGGEGGGRRGGGNRQVAVATAVATTGSLPLVRRTIGYIRPLASTNLATETVGIVAAIAARDGASVKAGDLLAKLDDRAAQALVAKDEAALARDRATLENAKASLERIQRLTASGASTQQAQGDAFALVKSAEATVGLDQAVLTSDQVALSKTEIRAPFDGRLGAFQVSVGSLVQPATTIVGINEVAPVYADFTLPETDLPVLRRALADKTLAVEVRPSLSPEGTAPASGPIVFLDNAVDETSASVRLRAELANGDEALWPGQSIDVTIDAGSHAGLVLVPGVAVQPREDGSIVYLVKPDNTVEVRKVVVALRVGDVAGIASGLAAGDKVVTEGQVDLADGTAVRDVAQEAAPAQGGAPAPAKAAGDPA